MAAASSFSISVGSHVSSSNRNVWKNRNSFVSLRASSSPPGNVSDSGDKIANATSSSKKVVPYANYAVPMDNSSGSSFITRPLAEILRDMNKRVPDKVVKIKIDEDGNELKYIPWFHANRMLSFYAPGWSGEVRSVTFSPDSRTVTVVYRVTIRGSDGEIFRESSGTAFMLDEFGDPVQKAEGMAFRRACARFGLGLYLYHEDESQ